MTRTLRHIIPLILLTLGSIIACGQKSTDDDPVKTKILFILDASGSMEDVMDGRTRMKVAKEVLSKLVDSLREHPRLELALRVYGHQSEVKERNCDDTRLEVPFAKDNYDRIINRIKSIDPKGTTLIAKSLQYATEDFDEFENTRNVIILITDGIEACGGDPCALSVALQKKNIFLKPFIIGLGSNPNFEREFSCMGQYFDASDVTTFKRVMQKVMTQTLAPTTVKVKLLDENDLPTETNVNVSFINQVTGIAEYDFVHYLDENGEPDNLDVDPILSYDVVVNTIPKVVKKNVYLEGGTENVIYAKTPQGTLNLAGKINEYKKLPAIIRKDNSLATLHVQNFGSSEKYLTGTYDIEVLTVPRKVINNVEIKQSETTTISIEQPGVLNIVDNIAGYGSIYKLNDDGSQEWIYNLEDENSKIVLPMQPGEYKFVFRSKKAGGSHNTDVQTFKIRPGLTTVLQLFKP